MPSIPERLTALERDQLAHERENRRALEAHSQQNLMALEAVTVRINEVEQKVEAFAPLLEGINTNLTILVNDKTLRDDRAKQPQLSNWTKFKDKLVESVATLIAGGVVAGVVWVAIQMLKG